MNVDVIALRGVAARIAGQHDAIVRQAQALEALEAGTATSGREYGAVGAGYVELMRGHVVQSVQEFAAEVRTVAGTVSATVTQYLSTEHHNAKRLRS